MLSRLDGMPPVKLLASRYRYLRLKRKPILGGIGPANMFDERIKECKLEQFISASGANPCNWLLFRKRPSSLRNRLRRGI